MWKIVIILLLIAAVIYGFSYFVFYVTFHRPKHSAKELKKYSDAPRYRMAGEGIKIMDSLPKEECFLISRDGLKLHAQLFPAREESNKYLIGIHGYHSYPGLEFGPFFEFYRSLGYHILLPDDRAHAPSEGKYIGFGVLDRLDCLDWTKYLVDRYGKDIKIMLHGISMGSATVLSVSGEKELPSQVEGIVADCGYTSAWEILSYQLKYKYHVPVKPFLFLAERICERKAGFHFHEYTPVSQVKKANVPILFIHGKKDRMVPTSMVYELYEACASRKRLLLVDEAAHAECVVYDQEGYYQAVREFFEI